jgi:hypothetical protein
MPEENLPRKRSPSASGAKLTDFALYLRLQNGTNSTTKSDRKPFIHGKNSELLISPYPTNLATEYLK